MKTNLVVLDSSLISVQEKINIELNMIPGIKYIVVSSTEKVDGLVKIIEI